MFCCSKSRQMPVKIVVVGDHTVGKTCLLFSNTRNAFPSGFIPDMFDSYPEYAWVDGKQVILQLWDTGSGEDPEHARLRPLCYPAQTNVFVACFSLIDPSTFQSVKANLIFQLQYSYKNILVLKDYK